MLSHGCALPHRHTVPPPPPPLPAGASPKCRGAGLLILPLGSYRGSAHAALHSLPVLAPITGDQDFAPLSVWNLFALLLSQLAQWLLCQWRPTNPCSFCPLVCWCRGSPHWSCTVPLTMAHPKTLSSCSQRRFLPPLLCWPCRQRWTGAVCHPSTRLTDPLPVRIHYLTSFLPWHPPVSSCQPTISSQPKRAVQG